MDLKAKIEQIKETYLALEAEKISIRERQKHLKKMLTKYETVLKHAESIESVEEKPLV